VKTAPLGSEYRPFSRTATGTDVAVSGRRVRGRHVLARCLPHGGRSWPARSGRLVATGTARVLDTDNRCVVARVVEDRLENLALGLGELEGFAVAEPLVVWPFADTDDDGVGVRLVEQAEVLLQLEDTTDGLVDPVLGDSPRA
jgi:hypothetical protein